MPDNFILPKRDVAATKALRANRFFLSGQSYITLPDDEGICHFVLEEIDRAAVRVQIAGRANGRCESLRHAPGCSRKADEMDHVRGGYSGRCDCFAHGRKKGNLQMLSRECHQQKHNRYPKFGQSHAEGIADFNRIYGEGK